MAAGFAVGVVRNWRRKHFWFVGRPQAGLLGDLKP